MISRFIRSKYHIVARKGIGLNWGWQRLLFLVSRVANAFAVRAEAGVIPLPAGCIDARSTVVKGNHPIKRAFEVVTLLVGTELIIG